MARRTLTASPEGIGTIRKTLKRLKKTQTYLAGMVGCSRQTIGSLLKGNPIDCDIFMDVCQKLGLNWETIAVSESIPSLDEIEIDVLVAEIREQVRPCIDRECGTMRVLDMTQPIGLGKIYTEVNILEKILGRRRLNLEQLLEGCSLEEGEFYRFGLSGVKERRVPGLEAVERYDKLMVLGQPGVGKTTFLKYLAIECSRGNFQSDRVALFVPLKRFAETDGTPSLLDYIAEEWVSWGANRERTEAKSTLELLLQKGRGLVLLDGLDEVREEDSDRIIREIQDCANRFDTCQFVATCRIAAREYTFSQFCEVEVAAFEDEQIQAFATRWFDTKELDFAEDFMAQLEANPTIKELATNPLLLTLLCLEFEDSGDFPADRAELYQRAVATLLRKWDNKRRIRRQQVYQQLSVPRKEDLLGQIAFRTFDRKEYFFKQRQVERHIADYICNLPDAPTDTEALHVDSEAVLKSMEAQHGLLVERARGIYSFSHLTFQEYFTARKIVTSPPVEAMEALQNLASQIFEKRWREVFLLAVQMLPSADELLQLMKREVDGLVAGDEKIQAFLQWVDRKTQAIDAPYKPAAIRAFYLSQSLSQSFSQSLDPLDRFRSFTQFLLESLSRSLDPLYQSLSRSLDQSLDQSLYQSLDQSLYQSLSRSLDLDQFLSRSLNLCRFLDQFLDQSLHLEEPLKTLKDQLPDPKSDIEIRKQWWEENGRTWTEQLRSLMIEHRHIGQDWQFDDEQLEQLQRYYDANQLLVDCLNSPCYVTRGVREDIEATLLLPADRVRLN